MANLNVENNQNAQVEIDKHCVAQFEYMVDNERVADSNTHHNKPIQLMKYGKTMYPRVERFSFPVELASVTSLNEKSDLDEGTLEYLRQSGDFPDVYYEQELEDESKTIAYVIDEAMEGILKEGTSLGKVNEARELMKELSNVRDLGTNIIARRLNIPTEIGNVCVRLYTYNAFWYKLINYICRRSELTTREKIKTIGPFCYLLELSLMGLGTRDIDTVYRGTSTNDEQRLEFMKPKMTFKGFTSTSKRRDVAEMFV